MEATVCNPQELKMGTIYMKRDEHDARCVRICIVFKREFGNKEWLYEKGVKVWFREILTILRALLFKIKKKKQLYDAKEQLMHLPVHWKREIYIMILIIKSITMLIKLINTKPFLTVHLSLLRQWQDDKQKLDSIPGRKAFPIIQITKHRRYHKGGTCSFFWRECRPVAWPAEYEKCFCCSIWLYDTFRWWLKNVQIENVLCLSLKPADYDSKCRNEAAGR